MGETIVVETPRHSHLMDGHGRMALVIPPLREDTDASGVKVLRLRLRPGDAMKKYYHIPNKDLDPEGTITQTYFEEDIQVLDINPGTGAMFLEKSFDNKPTKASNRHIMLKDTIKSQQKQIESLRRENARLHHEIKMGLTRDKEYWKGIIETANEIISVRGNIDNKFPDMGGNDGGNPDGQS